jgi:hypothetical protein
MRFIISIIDSQTRSSHSPEEIAVIDALNVEMLEAGYRIFAGGIDAPSKAKVFDNRNSANESSGGSFYSGPEFFSGFWIIDVPNQDIAEELARKGSLACNRKVELRPLLA